MNRKLCQNMCCDSRKFGITVENRDYHYLSQNETPGGSWAEIMEF
jgi:hypothetical protein